MALHLAAVALLRRLNAGAMYFWIKDLTQEFLKLSIIYSSVEIFDKVRRAVIEGWRERGALSFAGSFLSPRGLGEE